MVEYITYKSQELPIRISYYALKKFQEETGKDIEKIDTDISLMEPLLWFAMVAGHKAEGQALLLKRDEVEFILDECMNDFINLMGNFFPEAGKSGVKKKGK